MSFSPSANGHLRAKRAAATAAADLIETGMLVGLGSGSTTALFIEILGERCRRGLKVAAIASSNDTLRLAQREAIPLADIDTTLRLDLTVDGADEVDGKKQMIKGGGGALLREKIIASMSDEMVVIVDQSKLVDTLGSVPLPIEITPFLWRGTLHKIAAAGFKGLLRKTEEGFPYITDNDNYICDLTISKGDTDFTALNTILKAIPGVIETGLFLNLAGRVIIGKSDGTVEVR